MAKLKANGTEVARLQKTDPSPDGEGSYEYVFSVRSNGWVLKRSRWIRPDGSSSSYDWKRESKYPTETVTLCQKVRYLEEIGYKMISGTMSDVLHTQQTLARKRTAGPYEPIPKEA